MSKFPWKTTIAVAAVLAATVYAYAQISSGGPMGMHGRMAQGGMDGSMAQMHQQMTFCQVWRATTIAANAASTAPMMTTSATCVRYPPQL